MRTPVVLFIYRRPHTTKKVFDVIRQVKPSRLFIVANAPNESIDTDFDKCRAAREVVKNIDWNCQVTRKYSENYSECSEQILSGLNWTFAQVEEAIVLEDDCVPHVSFFRFCEELLDQYKYDNRIASISGTNYQLGKSRTDYSYYFSMFNHSWGWASWRRVWQEFDYNLKLWSEIKAKGILRHICPDRESWNYWNQRFYYLSNTPNKISWDYKWTLSCWLKSQMGIIPNVNLISNIGFDGDGAHCRSTKGNPFSNMNTQSLDFPLQHPPYIVRNSEADKFTQMTLFKKKPINILKNNIKVLLTDSQELLNIPFHI